MAREDIRNPVLQISVNPELYDRLNKVADMYGLTKNEIARVAIGQYVGQITGAIEAISKKSVQMPEIDLEKMIEIMIPKLVEMDPQVKGQLKPVK